MALLDDLAPGKRENAFYVKRGVQTADNALGDIIDRKGKIYVYEWDSNQQKHIGHLVDAEQYYNRSDIR